MTSKISPLILTGTVPVNSAVALLILIVLYNVFFKKSGPPLPPGPKGWPIVGNISDVPFGSKPEYIHWLEHKDKYGPFSSITVLGQTMVLLHGRDALNEIMEKRSAITGSRPQMFFSHNLAKLDRIFTFQCFNPTLRRERKMVHQQIGTQKAVANFYGCVDQESKRLLVKCYTRPEGLFDHIRAEVAAMMLRMTYAYSISHVGPDLLIDLIHDFTETASKSVVPGTWLVDLFPFLNIFPEGFPGTTFKKAARELRDITTNMADVPYEFVEKEMQREGCENSYVSLALSSLAENKSTMTKAEFQQEEVSIKWTAANMYAAGADTTMGTINVVILLMIQHPDALQKAHNEIERAIGGERLPDIKDRENLPFVNAIIKEALRIHPIVPTGVAHAVDEDIIYNGYKIPKGAYLIPSVWWACHDPSTYAEPMEFQPERFLAPRNELDPMANVFGYGRRSCPGKHFATDSLFFTISRLLACFSFTAAKDGQGNPIKVEFEGSAGLLCHTKPFQYAMAPRNEQMSRLLKSLEAEEHFNEGDGHLLNPEIMKKYVK